MNFDPAADLKKIVKEQDKQAIEEFENQYQEAFSDGIQAAIEVLAYQRESPHRIEKEKRFLQFMIDEISELLK